MPWAKLHAIVDVRARIILDCMVTDSVVADINWMYAMLGMLEKGAGNFYPEAVTKIHP